MLYLKYKGRYQKEYDTLFDLLVPQSGEAESLQGELVRAIRKLESDYYRNGSANFFSSYRGLATLLRKHLRLKSLFDEATIRQIERDIETMKQHGRGHVDYDEGEDCYDRITDRVVEYCRARPNLIWRDKSVEKPKTSIAHVFEYAQPTNKSPNTSVLSRQKQDSNGWQEPFYVSTEGLIKDHPQLEPLSSVKGKAAPPLYSIDKFTCSD